MYFKGIDVNAFFPDVWQAVASLAFTFGLPTIMCTMLWCHSKYDEIISPLIGILLWKKPVLRPTMDFIDLYRVANGGVPIENIQELWDSEERIMRAIKKSWFPKYDRKLLKKFHAKALDHLDELREAKWDAYAEQQRVWWNNFMKDKAEAEQRFKNNFNNTTSYVSSGWREILGVSNSETNVEVIKKAYRKAAMKEHPDRGGTGKKMPELNKAIEDARNELRFV